MSRTKPLPLLSHIKGSTLTGSCLMVPICTSTPLADTVKLSKTRLHRKSPQPQQEVSEARPSQTRSKALKKNNHMPQWEVRQRETKFPVHDIIN
ncbi:hypothetical protein J6590_024400 [Homalodisca vitripennis]|nr:hypothetical protein J6590_024400 [Homalodisca vitripennis]